METSLKNLPWRSMLARILPVLAALLTVVIFVADTLTTLEITFGVFYVVVVLISALFTDRRGVLWVAAGCMVLTVVSSLFTHAVTIRPAVIIGLIAIAATTYLALKIQSAEAEAQEARNQIAHFGRVAVLGELTASIAHEVNQPLAAVVTNGNACLLWLNRDPPDLKEARQALDRIVRDANRASEIVARVRRLAKRARSQEIVFDLNEAVTEILALTRRQIQENRIGLRTEFADPLPEVLGDRVQLQQVVLNLILNGIEAIEATTPGPHELIVETSAGADRTVVLTVSDTGHGLDPAKQGLLFQPFFTTKAEGMGMGLAISRSIVEAHGGHIKALPKAGRGATFEIILPAARRKV